MDKPGHAAANGLITGATLVTLDGDAGYGLVEHGALAWRDGIIRFAGPCAQLPAEFSGDAVDAGGACITPGLVDCHTHAVFAGDRAGEFEQRLQGADYEQIARAASNTRRVCPGVKAMRSQNASTASTSPSACSRGSHSTTALM